MKDKTRIQDSQARTRQPRVLKLSQWFNTYRNTGETKTVTKIARRERAEPTTQEEEGKNKHLRSNSYRRVKHTTEGLKTCQTHQRVVLSTRITKMWRCFVNQVASSQKCLSSLGFSTRWDSSPTCQCFFHGFNFVFFFLRTQHLAPHLQKAACQPSTTSAWSLCAPLLLLHPYFLPPS